MASYREIADVIEDREVQCQTDRSRHFFETCCTWPHFRTLCGQYVTVTREIIHEDPRGTGVSFCVVCEEMAKTPYFCRRCGQGFVLPS